MTTASEMIPLDMTNPGQPCVDCGEKRPTDERGRCQFCAEEISVSDVEPTTAPMSVPLLPISDRVLSHPLIPTPVDMMPNAFAAIASESTSNAAVQGIGSQRGPNATMRGVGFASREGYITAIRNGVPDHTHASYLTTLRAQYGMTSADLSALDLPGPMAVTALPVGAGIVHTPTGPSVFDRPRSERAFVVGPKADEIEQVPRIQIEHGKLVAGAAAEGHGVLIGWRGLGQLTRGKLTIALAEIGRSDLLPAPMSARSQAGQAVTKYNNLGMVVRVARRGTGATWGARWTILTVNHANKAGQSGGDIMLVIDLLPNGELRFEGDEAMAASIKADYDERIAGEIFEAGAVTSWLNGKLYDHFKAVSFGVGSYVPQKHAAAAEQLCEAVRSTGWGYGWISPALPIADSSQLRDGIVRGLKEEVADLMARLATEREIAKTERKDGDIGEKRAGTYLKALRDIGQRIVAYGQVLGEERVSVCRETVRTAIAALETLLNDDFTGISQRFAGVWEEIERDQRKSGGTL